MTSGENERQESTPPDGDGMKLLIGRRAGGEEATGARAPDRSAGDADESGAEAAADPASDPAATMAGQRLPTPSTSS